MQCWHMSSRSPLRIPWFLLLQPLVWRGVRLRRSVVSIPRDASWYRQPLGHHQLRAARPARHHVKLVHECLHQKNAPPGSAQQVFFRQRVRHVSQTKSLALVCYADDQLFPGQLHAKMNLFLGLFLVAIMKSVDYAFPHGHSDAVALFFVKAGGLRNTDTHLLGEINTLYVGIQRDFEMLGLWRHA